MSTLTGTAPVDDAREAVVTYNQLVEMLMATVDLLDDVQQGRGRVNVPNLRKATGKMVRKTTASHSLALAALVLDDSPDYAEELCDYAESLGQPPEDDEADGQ